MTSSYHLEDKNKNVPKLRFKGYNDEWVEKSFDEIFQIIGNNTFSRDCLSYEHIGTKNIHYGDILVKYNTCIDEDYCEIPIINYEISLDKIPMENYLKQGDIVIADTAEDYTVGKTCEVINIHSKILSGLHTIPSRPKFHFAKGFLGYYFNSNKYHDRLIPLITGIKVLSINKKEIKKTIVKFPTLPEQEKIASFLTLIDKKIEKQKKLVKLLKKYKRGLFERIFKEYGETSVKFADLLLEKNKKSKINNEYDIISSTKQGLFLQSEYFNKQTASKNTVGYKVLRKNQIVFSPQNLWMGNINFNSDFEIGIVSPSYKIYDINSNFNLYFVGLILKSSQALKEYALVSEQGASVVRRNLNIEMFNEITLKFPNKIIQDKLAKHMYLIQEYVNLQDKILNNLLKQKQGLLQQMFI